jgi:hypothetical protein
MKYRPGKFPRGPRDFTQPASPVKEEVDLNKIIREVQTMMQEQPKKTCPIGKPIGRDLPTSLLDPSNEAGTHQSDQKLHRSHRKRWFHHVSTKVKAVISACKWPTRAGDRTQNNFRDFNPFLPQKRPVQDWDWQ